MWFATQDGLNRYDGYEFVVYHSDPEDPSSLSDDFVQAILEDPSGALWLGTNTGGLNRFDPHSGWFVHYQNDPADPQSLSHNDVMAIYQDRDGILWLGTNGGGLNRFDPQTKRFTRYLNDPSNAHSLSHNAVAALCEDRTGVLWVGTLGGGLCSLDRETGEFVTYRNVPDDSTTLSNDFVQTIYEDSTGVLWVGTFAGGLNRFDRDSGQFVCLVNEPQQPHSLSDNNVQIIYEDRFGELWVGTGAGLDRLDRATGQSIHYRHASTDANSLSNDNVLAIRESREGVLWIGTVGGGVNKVDRTQEQFTYYRHDPDDPNSLSFDGLWGIYEDRQGILWLGTNGGGLNRFDPQAESFTYYQNQADDPTSLSNDAVYCVYQDRAGTLWVGTGAGLDRFDQATQRFKRYPTSIVLSILEDEQGTLWLGTIGGGLGIFDRETEQFSFYANDPNDPSTTSDNTIVQVYEDRENVLWIATFSGGLERFDRGTERFAHYTHNPEVPQSLSSNAVLAVYEDSKGALWVATTGGLDRLDRQEGTFTHYREKDGLPNEVVYGMLEDEQGFLWVSTNGGLSRFDSQHGTFRNYTERDGLQSNEFNMSSYCKSRSGEMFFGGINGLNAFYPDAVQDDLVPPPVVITKFELFNAPVAVGAGSPLKEPIAETEAITLSYRDDFFSFEFAGLNYAAPEQNQYAYMMDGLDKDWNYVGNRRFAGYTSVPAGTYTFKVKASNGDGVWNERGASLRIAVVPPFWQTWWFRVLVVSALAGSALVVFAVRVRSIEAQRRRLEVQVNERTRELGETLVELERAKDAAEAASRAKSVFLANMSHEFRTPLNAILGFAQLMRRSPHVKPEEQEDLDIIHRSGEHLLGLINDVLQLSKIEAGRTTLNPQSFDLHRMLAGLEDMFRLRAEQKGIALYFDVSPDVPQFVRMDEGKLRQVLMNLLGNAVKFTQQGGVSLRATTPTHPTAPPRPRSAAAESAGRSAGGPVTETDSGRLQVLFEVEDTGPGIAPAEVALLFDPFVQTASGQHAQEGTGLGLAISQQFVRLMDGEISVRSEVGKGSTFCFEVPVEAAAPADVLTAQPVRRVLGLAPGQPAHRLLVVDDKEVNRKLLVKMLAPLGFEVREAADGREAIDAWESWEPQLIFMDMRMPGMDGYEATRRIKATTRGHATIIIALTASALEEDREVILSEGCDDYMRKPFREADLLAALEKHLGARFLYAEAPAGQPAPTAEPRAEGTTLPDGPTLSAALATMPPAWLDELQEATILGNLQGIMAVVDRVRERDRALAEALERLANGFAHDVILGAIELAGGRHDHSSQ
jgi:signal transduction histidine kinase/ligand-binding sensor domain-containing protein/ActR/RegA family two-component response regulator